MRRRPVLIIQAVVFGLLGLNAWGQVVSVLLGRSDDPPVLTALQFAVGAAGVAAAWGIWKQAEWAWVAAIAYGVVTAGMLLALPALLELPADARTGIWGGAAVVMVLSLCVPSTCVTTPGEVPGEVSECCS